MVLIVLQKGESESDQEDGSLHPALAADGAVWWRVPLLQLWHHGRRGDRHRA